MNSVLLLLLCVCAVLPGAVSAQQTPHRKVVFSVKPEYPATLKGAGIGGVVRLEVKVQANGTVSDTAIIGGNPILAETAEQAVMKWKYIPMATPTIEQVTVTFSVR